MLYKPDLFYKPTVNCFINLTCFINLNKLRSTNSVLKCVTLSLKKRPGTLSAEGYIESRDFSPPTCDLLYFEEKKMFEHF